MLVMFVASGLPSFLFRQTTVNAQDYLKNYVRLYCRRKIFKNINIGRIKNINMGNIQGKRKTQKIFELLNDKKKISVFDNYQYRF